MSCPYDLDNGYFVSAENLKAVEDATFTVGQLAGPGTYRCVACQKERTEYALSFEIEPCPCGGTTFVRVD